MKAQNKANRRKQSEKARKLSKREKPQKKAMNEVIKESNWRKQHMSNLFWKLKTETVTELFLKDENTGQPLK